MLHILNAVAGVIFKMVSILMRAAPIGAFGAFAFVISSQGVEAIQKLALLIGTVYLTSFLFIVIVLGAVSAWAGFNILKLIRYLKEELFLVLGTSSSESALPALMEKWRGQAAPSRLSVLSCPPATRSISTAPTST